MLASSMCDGQQKALDCFFFFLLLIAANIEPTHTHTHAGVKSAAAQSSSVTSFVCCHQRNGSDTTQMCARAVRQLRMCNQQQQIKGFKEAFPFTRIWMIEANKRGRLSKKKIYIARERERERDKASYQLDCFSIGLRSEKRQHKRCTGVGVYVHALKIK